MKLPFVCLAAHDWKFRRWVTSVNVKLLLPPRQSRGVSRVMLVQTPPAAAHIEQKANRFFASCAKSVHGGKRPAPTPSISSGVRTDAFRLRPRVLKTRLYMNIAIHGASALTARLGSLSEEIVWLYDQTSPFHFVIGATFIGRGTVAPWREVLDMLQRRHPLLRVRIEREHLRLSRIRHR